MLSQVDDLWAAVVTCLDMFDGGGSWRGNMSSTQAWRKAGRSLSRVLSGTMRVALPPDLVPVLEACLVGADAAGSAAFTAQRAAEAMTRTFAIAAPAGEGGVAPTLAGSMYANIALALHQRQRLTEAESCYRDAVAATQSRDPRALNNLGVLCAQTGDEAEARRCFEVATALDAGYQEANMNLARLRDGSSGAKCILDLSLIHI